MVDLRSPLNPRQLAVLRWINDGRPDGVMQGHTYKTVALALQNRRLATVSKKGGIWCAELTETGRHYLQHGVVEQPVEHTDANPCATPID